MSFSHFVHLIIFLLFNLQPARTQDAVVDTTLLTNTIEKSANILLLVDMQTDADRLMGADLQQILDDVHKMVENNAHPYGNRLTVVKHANSQFQTVLKFNESTDAQKVKDALRSDTFPESEKVQDKSLKDTIEKAVKEMVKFDSGDDRHILPTFTIYITSVKNGDPAVAPEAYVRNKVCKDLRSAVTIVYLWYHNVYTEYLCTDFGSNVTRFAYTKTSTMDKLQEYLTRALTTCTATSLSSKCTFDSDKKCMRSIEFNRTNPHFCPNGKTSPIACPQQACDKTCMGNELWVEGECDAECGSGNIKFTLKPGMETIGQHCVHEVKGCVMPTNCSGQQTCSNKKCVPLPTTTTPPLQTTVSKTSRGPTTPAPAATPSTSPTTPQTAPPPAATTEQLIFGVLTVMQMCMIGGGGGALILLIIVLVCVCCYKKKQKRRKSRQRHTASNRRSAPPPSRSRSGSSSATQGYSSSTQNSVSSVQSVTQGSVSEVEDKHKRRGRKFPLPMRKRRPDPVSQVKRDRGDRGGPMKPRSRDMPPARSPRKPPMPSRSPRKPPMPTRSPRPPMPSRSPRPPMRRR